MDTAGVAGNVFKIPAVLGSKKICIDFQAIIDIPRLTKETAGLVLAESLLPHKPKLILSFNEAARRKG